MNYSKINISFLRVSAFFFPQNFLSLFGCIMFGGQQLFLFFLIHARLSGDRSRVTGLAQRAWPKKDQENTQGSEGKSHSSIQSGETSPCSQLWLHPKTHIHLWEEQESSCRPHHPKTASKPQLWQKSLCCIIQFYRILSAASLHVLNRALTLRCLDSSLLSGDDHTLL